MNETNTVPESATKSYLVPCERLPELTRRLDKLVRRSGKLGVAPISYALGDIVNVPYERRYQDSPRRLNAEDKAAIDSAAGRGTFFFIPYQNVQVTGTTPRLAGWAFVATLQHLTDDRGETINMLRTVPTFKGEMPAQFRTATPENCDHCGKHIRTRKDTFVVVHEDGTWKQVGRNCTQDFLGGVDPQAVASALECLLQAGSACSDEEGFTAGCSGDAALYSMTAFLTTVAMFVRSEGWVSRGKSRATDGQLSATADNVLSYLGPPPKDGKYRAEWEKWVAAHPVTDEDRETARKALEFGLENLVSRL
jgi:hypothetical protein